MTNLGQVDGVWGSGEETQADVAGAVSLGWGTYYFIMPLSGYLTKEPACRCTFSSSSEALGGGTLFQELQPGVLCLCVVKWLDSRLGTNQVCSAWPDLGSDLLPGQ